MKAYTVFPLLLLTISYLAGNLSAQSFSYDLAGRTTEARYADGTIVKYKYDAAANLKKAKVVPGVTASISAQEPSGNVLHFSVRRAGDLTQALTVGLASTGDAVNGQDYSLPARVTFPANESSTSFTITLREDRPASVAKKLIVNLADGDDYSLDKRSSVTITLPNKK